MLTITRKDLYFNGESLTNGGNDNGPDDTFISKFNDQGVLLWLKKASCNLYSNSYDLTINKKYDIILTGYFRGSMLIGDKVYKSTVPYYYDIYVLNLNNYGNLNWFKSFGGDSPMNDIGYGVTSDKNNLFVTGMYGSNSWFDNNQINCKGASDIFVLNTSLFQIKVSDLSGREIIIQKLLKLKVNEIDVSNLFPGIYFLQLKNLNNRNFFNKKFIKAF